MQRDMDLIRSILMVMADHPDGNAPHPLKIAGYTDEQIGYHCYLLADAGLIVGIDATNLSSRSPYYIPSTMRWEGYEFLESSRDPDVWKQAKDVVGKVGGASLNVWTSVLTKIVMQNLGLDS
jgi:hypothetical protein